MKTINQFICCGMALLWASSGMAQPANANGGAPGAWDQQLQARDLTGKRGQEQVDLFTGSFLYSIPINCAPARNNSQPALALAYSSGGENGWCGMGWKLGIGYIERNTKDGFPIQLTTAAIPAPGTAYDDTKGFLLDLYGKEYKLYAVATNSSVVEYRAETDTDFLRCFLDTSSNNKWTVYDKSGNAYLFGQSTSSRMANPKTGWSGYSGTFHWGLDEIDTATGDRTSVAYTTYNDPSMSSLAEMTIYPTAISYNGHISLNGYTQSASNNCTITFGTALRSDQRISFRSGFRTEQNRILTNIVSQVNGQQVWRYALAYTTSTATGRSLLNTMTVYGSDNTTALPTQTFSYQQNPNAVSFGPPILWTNLSTSTYSTYPYITYVNPDTGVTLADLFDIDGDGLPDRAVWNSGSVDTYQVQHNSGFQNGAGSFAGPNAYGPSASGGSGSPSASNPLPSGGYWSALNDGYTRMHDINGDGLPDRVNDWWAHFGTSFIPYTNFVVMLNTGNGFGSAFLWPLATNDMGAADTYTYMSLVDAPPSQAWAGLFDINGDGLPDRVMGLYNQATTYYKVQYNVGGTNFGPVSYFGPLRSQNYTNAALGNAWAGIPATANDMLIDLNGDGLPDHVMMPMNSTGGRLSAASDTYFAVEFNNGYSFESTNTSPSVPGAYDRWAGVNPQVNAVDFAEIQNLPYVGLYDLNGDGLPDRVMMNSTNMFTANPTWLVYLNNGKGFNATPVVVSNIDNQGEYNGSYIPVWGSIEGTINQSVVTTLMDINGDGLLDRVMNVYNGQVQNQDVSSTSNYFIVQLNQGPFPDLLTNVNNGMGGNYAVTYQPSTAYNNLVNPGDPNSGSVLPFIYQTVSTVTEMDGVNPARTTGYGYSGGYYNGPRREFHGFAMVTVTNPPSPISAPYDRVTAHYFHQGGGQNHSIIGEYSDAGAFAKEGMEYRTVSYGNDGNLYHVTVNQINQTYLGNGRYFPYVQLAFECDSAPGTTNRVTLTKLLYDLSNGNLTNKIEYGEVTGFNPASVGTFSYTDANSGDNRFHYIHYAALSNTYIVDHPDKVTLKDNGGTIIREEDYTYDGSSGTPNTKLTLITSGYYATNGFGNYNMYGLVGLTTDPVGVQTKLDYDSSYTFKTSSRVRAEANSDTSSDFIATDSYDPRSGLVTGSTSPTGVTITNTYDALCRLKESDRIPVGGSAVWITKVGYNLGAISSGTAVSYMDETNNDGVGGMQIRTYVDGFDRPIQERIQGENNNFRVVSVAYDELGQRCLTTWPTFGSTATFSIPVNQTANWIGFDAAGRVTTNQLVTASFSGNGAFTGETALVGDTGSPLAAETLTYANGSDPWWVISTDEDGKVHRYQLDAYGRTNLIQEVDGANTYSTTLKYDLVGNLTNIVNANQENIYFAYDNAGRMAAMADPYLGQWTYQRDYAGRVRVQTDGRRDVVKFSYINPATIQQDVMGRIQTQLVYGTNATPIYGVTNIYDTVYKGLLYTVIDSQGSETNGYDNRGRLTNNVRHLNINNRNYAVSYTYNDADKITSTIYPNSGPTITNQYFTGDSIKQVSLYGGSQNYYTVSASAYDQFGHVTGFAYGNGLSTTYTYYPKSERLQNIACGSVFNRTYSYTAANDITNISGTGITNTVTVTYDNLHRIKTYTGLTGSYGYDSVGTITTNIEFGGPQVYSYGMRRAQAVRSEFAMTNLYDLCGNMIVRQAGVSNSQALTYDAENRLVRFAQARTNFLLVEFGYAGDGTRLWKWINQSPTNLQVWIGNIYEEKGGKALYHVFAGSQLVCSFETNSALYGNSADTNHVGYYYHQDNLNSSTALSSGAATGTQIEVNVFYPFGRQQVANPQASFKVSRQFTGQIKDDETGLYYLTARYYDPLLGRFIQADTLVPDWGNPQSYNRYSYCHNNPLCYTDPSGHDDSYTGASGRAMLQAEDGEASRVAQGGRKSAAVMAAVMKTAVAVTPAGTAMNVGEAVTGKEAYSGDQLTWKQRTESGAMAAMPAVLKGVGKLAKAGKAAATASRGVWALGELERGMAIEDRLAATEYKEWFRVGSLDKGKFPLVDFQKGNNLVSLKTIDTSGTSWLNTMQTHIQDLGTLGHTVDGQPANMILDIRVQPGGAKAAEQLIDYGKQFNVTVKVSEFQ